MTTSIASSMAVCFGAPIGGVIFSLELFKESIHLGSIYWNFLSATLSVIFNSIFCYFIDFKNISDLLSTWKQTPLWFEMHHLPLFFILGILISCLGSLFLNFYSKFLRFRQSTTNSWLTNRYKYMMICMSLICMINLTSDEYQFGFRQIIADLISFYDLRKA